MRKAKLFVINVTILTATAILMQSIGIIFSVYISNKIGAEGVGIFQLIMSVYTFAITLASSGINLAVTRIASEEKAKKNENGAQKAVKECIILSLLLGIFSCILLLLLSNIITEKCFHNKITNMPLKIIAFSLPFISMSAAINGYFSAERKVYKTASSQIFEQVLRILISCLLINSILPSGIEYACISLVSGTCISECLSFIYIYIFYINGKRKLKKSNFLLKSNTNKTNYLKEIFSICIPIAITSYIRSGLSTLKQLIIPLRLEKSGLSCESALAKYGLIGGMVMPILLFPSVFINSFSMLLIPEFSSIFVTKNYNRVKTLSTKIFKITMLFSACVFGIFLNFYKELGLYIYKSEIVGKYLLMLSPLVMIIYIDTVVDGMLKGINEQVAVMKINIIDLFTSITFIYFLLPLYSINGYIAVIYISEILNGVLSIIRLKKITNIKLDLTNFIIKPVAICFLSRYVINFFNLSLGNNILTLIVEVLLYILLYMVLLFMFKCLKKEDLRI